jgi:hypothetical protein
MAVRAANNAGRDVDAADIVALVIKRDTRPRFAVDFVMLGRYRVARQKTGDDDQREHVALPQAAARSDESSMVGRGQRR